MGTKSHQALGASRGTVSLEIAYQHSCELAGRASQRPPCFNSAAWPGEVFTAHLHAASGAEWIDIDSLWPPGQGGAGSAQILVQVTVLVLYYPCAYSFAVWPAFNRQVWARVHLD